MPASERSRPYVVAHVAIAIDGATTGFPADLGRFYELARTWDEDVTLTGADTVLAQEEALRTGPRPGPAADGPLLAVVDGRARVSEWEALLAAGFWSDVLALRCAATPPHPGTPPVAELAVGDQRVDLRAALEALGARPGISTVRVDSGGGLTGALLSEELVDEVSLLLHPWWTGSAERPWHGNAAGVPAVLELVSRESIDQLVWLRYRFRR